LRQSNPREIRLGVGGLFSAAYSNLYDSCAEQVAAFVGLAQVAAKLETGWPASEPKDYSLSARWVLGLMSTIARDLPDFRSRYLHVGRTLPTLRLRELWRQAGLQDGFSQRELDEVCSSPLGDGEFSGIH